MEPSWAKLIMKKTLLKNLFSLLIISSLLFCGLALTAASQGTQNATNKTELPNPLKVTSIPVFLGNVIKGILGIVGSLALAMFIYGGLMWLTSQGNPEKIKKGQDTIVWAVLGLVLIFSSYIILNFIFKALTRGTEITK